VNTKTRHCFALDPEPQTIVAAFAKGYGHCLRAAPCFAALSINANSVFNQGF
jgi:hypothetical protein